MIADNKRTKFLFYNDFCGFLSSIEVFFEWSALTDVVLLKREETTATIIQRILPMRCTAFLASTAFGLTLTFADPVAAEDVINIPAQALASALTELAEETGLQVVASPMEIEGKTSKAVNGAMTPEDALREMLSDTDLSFNMPEPGGVVLSLEDLVSQNSIDEAPFDLGTIVVTGERVERDVFSTTSSVRVFGGKEIDREPQYKDVERVFEGTGNVTTLGQSNLTPVIRGQLSGGPTAGAGAALSGTLPRASFTVDGSQLPVGNTRRSSTWDLEAIEVFRGPQTTSQGANSIAGAINVRTRDPVFDTEFAARGELGSDNNRGASLMANTALSESVALRFTFDYQDEDAFVSFPRNTPSEATSFNQRTARLKLLWEPNQIPGLSTKLTYSYDDYTGPQTLGVMEPFDDLRSNFTDGVFIPWFETTSNSLVHDISYDLGSGLSVRNRLQYSQIDAARRTANPGQPDFEGDSDDLTNEFIVDYLSSNNPLSGFFGIYARQTNENTPSDASQMLNDERSSFGVFAEATYRFANNIDVTAGLRYQKDSQDREVSFLFGPSLLEFDFDESFDALLPKLAVGYQPDEDTRYSIQISRGYNPGGAGASFLALLGFPIGDPFYTFAQETVTNYELALRKRLMNGRLFVAPNAFFSNYENYQIVDTFVIPGVPLVDGQVENAEKVETYGLELEFEYLATDALSVNGSLGLLRTEIKEFSGDSVGVEGNRLPYAPAVTFSVGFDYQVTRRFTVGGQIRYSDGYFSDLENLPENEVDNFTTVDLRASYAITDRAELYSYVNNVFDDISPIALGSEGTFATVTDPREFGIGLRAVW